MTSMVVGILFSFPVKAQLAAAQEAIGKMYQRYEQSHFLTFDVKYTYLTDSAGQHLKLDEMLGQYTMSGRRAIFRLGDVEYMQNDSMFISLYKNDQMIVVGDAREANAGGYLPLRSMMDSLLNSYSSHFTITVSVSDSLDSLSLIKFTALDDLAVLDSFSVSYYKETNLIAALDYYFSAPEEVEVYRSEEAPSNKKRRLLIEFQNYRFDNLSPSIYNTNNYVWLENGEYRAAPKYKEFQVFNARSR